MQQGGVVGVEGGGEARGDAGCERVMGEEMGLEGRGECWGEGDVEEVPGCGEEGGAVGVAGQDDPADYAGDGERGWGGGGEEADGGREGEGGGEVQEVDVSEGHCGLYWVARD